MRNEVVIITQARMTSTRLPGKILMRAGERTLLETHLDRLADVGVPVIVATTTNLSDGLVVELCAALDVPVFRGSENDVLER
ncbi:MAG: acylneuraminate cytidylyltransferase, partial [Nitrobacter sp.]